MNVLEFGFLQLRWIDIIDIFLVALLIYGLYKIIKGSIAISIFFGFIFIYFLWFIVRALDMKLISSILNQFLGIGVIAMIIVFQQEIRRFLLTMTKNNLLSNDFSFLRLLPWNWNKAKSSSISFDEIATACLKFSKSGTGALIIVKRNNDLKFFIDTGTPLEAGLNVQLLETIFQKKSPLHDGAVIIVEDKIMAASCILPVSERLDLPPEYGLRHRSAIGISESTDALAIIVSEETGKISVASKGVMERDLNKSDLGNEFYNAYNEI